MTLTYDAGERLPDAHLTIYDDTSTLIDLSSGYTFSASLTNVLTDTVAHTQSTGIAGAATSPNVTIAWTSGFANITAGHYELKVTGTRTSDSKLRIWTFPLVVI
jgi:hypothetical protein